MPARQTTFYTRVGRFVVRRASGMARAADAATTRAQVRRGARRKTGLQILGGVSTRETTKTGYSPESKA